MAVKNRIIEVTLSTDVNSEPVALQQVKNWLKMDYSADDSLIQSLITTARKQCEQYAGISIGTQTRVIHFSHDGEKEIRLPYGPISEVTALTYRPCRLQDWTSVLAETDNWELEGSFFSGYKEGIYKATVTCGVINMQITDAIMAQVTYLYENRGDKNVYVNGLTAEAAGIMHQFKELW